jgi:predicted nucleic acid-binding protein
MPDNIKVFDSSVIFAFIKEDELNRPDLLVALTNFGYTVAIPHSVQMEIRRKKIQSLTQQWQKEGTLTVLRPISAAKQSEFHNEYCELGHGETEVILWGIKLHEQHKKYYCVLSDGPARNAAKEKGITCTGTRGIIRYLERKKAITSDEASSCVNWCVNNRH